MQKPSASELAQISILLNPKLAQENPGEALRKGMNFWEETLALVDDKASMKRVRNQLIEEFAQSDKPLDNLSDELVLELTTLYGGKRYAIKKLSTLRKLLGKKPGDPIYRAEIEDYYSQLKKKHSEKQALRRREKNAVNKPLKTDTKKSKKESKPTR
jgi:hypothetical protein